MKTNLQDDETIEVAMAPLIDCVFLLLIFFLVATTLKKIDEELPLTLPDAKATVEVQQPDDFLVVSLDREGNLYLDAAPVTIDVFQQAVRDRVRTNPEVKARVDADRDLPFNRVMEILDLLRFENLPDIGINTRQGRPGEK